MILCTSPDIPGREIVEVLGLVRGNSIRARHMGHDFIAALKNLVGGEIEEYTKLMGESREQAIDRMVDAARAMDADAIISLHITTSMIQSQAAEILAYGTAVKLR